VLLLGLRRRRRGQLQLRAEPEGDGRLLELHQLEALTADPTLHTHAIPTGMMETIQFAPPSVHRVRWENRRVKGSGGKLFNEAVILARGGTRCYLLLRLLAHDKPHVATMLACRVREDRVSGLMVQEQDAHVVIKVRVPVPVLSAPATDPPPAFSPVRTAARRASRRPPPTGTAGDLGRSGTGRQGRGTFQDICGHYAEPGHAPRRPPLGALCTLGPHSRNPPLPPIMDRWCA
jgi:hypothetical protein